MKMHPNDIQQEQQRNTLNHTQLGLLIGARDTTSNNGHDILHFRGLPYGRVRRRFAEGDPLVVELHPDDPGKGRDCTRFG